MDNYKTQLLTTSNIKTLLKPRDFSANKGDYGHSLLIAGGMGKMGAAVIAARACLRSGTGLLTVCVPKSERSILQTAIPEAMISFREDNTDFSNISAVGIGPGIGLGKGTGKTLKNLLKHFNGAVLLDADALNLLAANHKLFKKLPKVTVITPHPKEFDSLFGSHASEEERRNAAIDLAIKLELVIVLKGHQTLVTTAGCSFLSTAGNAGLAKGGSGDALTGIITALLAQGYESFVAAKIGVYLHGLAADIALVEQSMESMLIDDVIACLGEAFKQTMA
ncbi:NAD(P)H-hydrate dehydratase [Pedobacter sp. SL55]|uniref:NAD(P)H-hydrate dehydratase n=1 Tax=Pedobacter sp. SL55 TaxID=2995161 RepID=UPI002270C4D5|nr:NAD(P)H-hydrate dehydratase [Pedobacter sp. SL55]WAC39395.1 NAD(P)H-hydrate dehydratase [Pedobacter sp. SL55]